MSRIFDIFVHYGMPLLISLIFGFVWLYRMSFRLSKISWCTSINNMKLYEHLLKSPRFHYNILSLVNIVQWILLFPIIMFWLNQFIMTVYYVQPKINGVMISLIIITIILWLIAFGRWSKDQWRLSKTVKRLFNILLITIILFQLCTVTIKPYTFETISATFLLYNILLLIGVLYLTSPVMNQARNEMRGVNEFLRNKLDLSTSFNTYLGVTITKEYDRKEYAKILYFCSMIILIIYSILVYYLLDGDKRGIVVSCCFIVLDISKGMYSTINNNNNQNSTLNHPQPNTLVILIVFSRVSLIIFGHYWLNGVSIIYFLMICMITYQSVKLRKKNNRDKQNKYNIRDILKLVRYYELPTSNSISKDSITTNATDTEPPKPLLKLSSMEFINKQAMRFGPVTIWLFLTLSFSLLLFIAYIQPNAFKLPMVSLPGIKSQPQYKFGISMIFLGINASFMMYTVGLFIDNHWKLKGKPLLYATLAIISIIGSGIFLFWLTNAYIILIISIFGGPLFFNGLLSLSFWRQNDFELLDPPHFRNPPYVTCCRAFFMLGLTRQDYIRLVSLILYVVNILLFSLILSLSVKPVWIGWIIGSILLELSLTSLAILKWYHTLRVGIGLIMNIITAILLLLSMSFYIWINVLNSVISKKSLFLLFGTFLYPTIVCVFLATYQFLIEDRGRIITSFVKRCIYTSSLLMLTFAIVVIYFWDVAFGIGLIVLNFISLGIFKLFHIYKQNDNTLPRNFRKYIFIILSLVAIIGILIGILSERENSGVIGYSFSWGCVAVALMALSNHKSRLIYYSKQIFPVFSYNPIKDNVNSFNTVTLTHLFNILMLLMWGVMATFTIKPIYIGSSVISLSLILIISHCIQLYQKTPLQVGQAMHLLDDNDDVDVLDFTLIQASSKQFLNFPLKFTNDNKEEKTDLQSGVKHLKTGIGDEMLNNMEEFMIQSIKMNHGKSLVDSTKDVWTTLDVFDNDINNSNIKDDNNIINDNIDEDDNMNNEQKNIIENRNNILKRAKAAVYTFECLNIKHQQLKGKIKALIIDLNAEALQNKGLKRMKNRSIYPLSASQSLVTLNSAISSSLIWSTHHDIQSNRKFYFNQVTGESTWKKPELVKKDEYFKTLLVKYEQSRDLLQWLLFQLKHFYAHFHLLLIIHAERQVNKRIGEIQEFCITKEMKMDAQGRLLMSQDDLDAFVPELLEWRKEKLAKKIEIDKLQENEEKQAKNRMEIDPDGDGILEEDECKMLLNDVLSSDNKKMRMQTSISEGGYLDDKFPPTSETIGEGILGYGEGRCIWQRPPFPNTHQAAKGPTNSGILFKSKQHLQISRYDPIFEVNNDINMSPNDVVQGALGDCYFLSAISVMSTHPQRLLQLFINPQPNAAGIYGIRFWRNGKWRYIVVDDCFPCSTGTEQPLYVHAPDNLNTLWPMLLEKAYAKMHGSFARIRGGRVADALLDISGPNTNCEEFLLKNQLNPDALWSRLQRYNDSGFLMGAHSPESPREVYTPIGIVHGHAYAILNLAEVSDKNGEHRLVQLRNPHGAKEWKGAWSDKSPQWTQRTRQKLNHNDKEDGVFWMTLSDLLQHFRTIYVCRLFNPPTWNTFSDNASWNLSEKTAAGPPNGKFDAELNPQYLIQLKTARKTECFVSVIQEENDDPDAEYRFQPCAFYIVKNNGKRLHAIKARENLTAFSGAFKKVREVSSEVILEPYEPGYTMVVCAIKPGFEGKFTLAIHTNNESEIRRLDESTQISNC